MPGNFEKVVLARATDLYFNQPVNAASLMAASRALNLNCYHFCMMFDAENAFLGSTPERLWRRRGMLLRTEAWRARLPATATIARPSASASG